MQVSFAYMRGVLAGIAERMRREALSSTARRPGSRLRSDLHGRASGYSQTHETSIQSDYDTPPLARLDRPRRRSGDDRTRSGSETAGDEESRRPKLRRRRAARSRPARRRARGRQAVHVVHLADDLKKPVLYPLRAASGTVVTRGFPLEPRPGERVDHPHHVGLWFNYGDVNGLDFWNNSDAIKADAGAEDGHDRSPRSIRAPRAARARARSTSRKNGWTTTSKPLLREDTRFVFRAANGVRSIDRITTLTALDYTVTFKDNKEGVIGMRVARELEHPSLTSPRSSPMRSGRRRRWPSSTRPACTGTTVVSEGKEGDAVWGTRGRWTMLTGDVGGAPVTLAILDHPEERRIPDLLARAGLRAVRREPARPEGDEQRQGGAELQARAEAIGHVPPRGADPGRESISGLEKQFTRQ